MKTITCDICLSDIQENNFEESITINHRFGYGSSRDGEILNKDICIPCLEQRIIPLFKITYEEKDIATQPDDFIFPDIPPTTVKELYEYGVGVFGDFNLFIKWSMQPSLEFNVKKIAMLFNENQEDLNRVYTLLGRIEYNTCA